MYARQRSCWLALQGGQMPYSVALESGGGVASTIVVDPPKDLDQQALVTSVLDHPE